MACRRLRAAGGPGRWRHLRREARPLFQAGVGRRPGASCLPVHCERNVTYVRPRLGHRRGVAAALRPAPSAVVSIVRRGVGGWRLWIAHPARPTTTTGKRSGTVRPPPGPPAGRHPPLPPARSPSHPTPARRATLDPPGTSPPRHPAPIEATDRRPLPRSAEPITHRSTNTAPSHTATPAPPTTHRYPHHWLDVTGYTAPAARRRHRDLTGPGDHDGPALRTRRTRGALGTPKNGSARPATSTTPRARLDHRRRLQPSAPSGCSRGPGHCM